MKLRQPSEAEIAYLHGFILGLTKSVGLTKSSEETESVFHRLCDLEFMFCKTMGIDSKLTEWKIIDEEVEE